MALIIVCCVAVGGAVVMLLQGDETGANDLRGWFIVGLLPFATLAVAADWARERATIAEWDRAQEHGQQLVPPRDPNESLSDKLSPATKRDLALRGGLILLLLLAVGIASLLE